MTETQQPPETPETRKARQYAMLRQIGELGMDLAQTAHPQAKQQLAAPPHARPKNAPDYAATFASMSRSVRQTIAIEIRLDAPARTRPTFRLARLADPRRNLLRLVFQDAARASPDLRREINVTIDHILDADPDQQIPIGENVATLCNALSIDLDLSRIPDELLDAISPPPPPPSRTTHPPPRAAP